MTHPANPDDTRLFINVLGGGCHADDEKLGAVRVDESASEVRVTTHLRKPPSGDEVCPAVGTSHAALVCLSGPLGDRSIIDGVTGRPPPVVQTGSGNEGEPGCANETNADG